MSASIETSSDSMVAGATASQLAGLCFALLAGQFLTVIMLAASIAPDYDVTVTAISDLGVIPETALIFNFSLLVTGTLNIIGSALLFGRTRKWASLIIASIAGFGAIGAGLITLASPGVHGIFALLAFVFFNIQMLVGAAGVRGILRAVGLGLGLVGLAYVVLMFFGDAGYPQLFGPIGHGGTERMIVYPPMLWYLVYGGALLGGMPTRLH